MSEPTVVALLDQWIAALKGHPAAWAGISYEEVERLRDEIVALRAQLEAVRGIAGNERKLSEAIIQQARNEALEEAARVVEDYFNPETCGPCAAAIRKLAGSL